MVLNQVDILYEKQSGSKAEILRNLEVQPKPLVSYIKKKCTTFWQFSPDVLIRGGSKFKVL